MTKKMTRKQALELAIRMFKEHEYGANETFMTELEGVPAVEVLNKMLISIDKQSNKPKTPSKARLENEKLADNLVGEMVAIDKPVDTKWITEHVRFVTNSQKANAVVKIAMEKGDIVREVDEKKHVWYRLAE